MLKNLMKFLSDLYNGPDGETWSLGRIYSIPLMGTGLSVPVIALMKGQALSMGDVGLGLGGLAAAVGAMVAITNHIDNPASAKSSGPI
jgi:hypothetical protein